MKIENSIFYPEYMEYEKNVRMKNCSLHYHIFWQDVYCYAQQ